MSSPMNTTPTPRDLVLRIALVDENLNELEPSVWRRIRVSAHVNLDLLHDKILLPAMGWTRNYHTYFMRKMDNDIDDKDDITYYQASTNAPDTIHVGSEIGDVLKAHLVGDTTTASRSKLLDLGKGPRADPESTTIGELLQEPGDRMIYVYDLGDTWHHLITLKEISPAATSTGAVVVEAGAMRCPDEDGEGCATYQTDILDLYNRVQADPFDDIKARKLSTNCFERRNALNVRGPFWPASWSIATCQANVDEALRSRNYARNSVKMFSQGHFFEVANAGQQFVKVAVEDERGGPNNLFRMTMGETINLQPDPIDDTLCCGCGNPVGLKRCGACKCAQYCSSACQAKEWKLGGHKRLCKKEKARLQKYQQNELANGRPEHRIVHNGRIYLKKYDAANLRMKVGDQVECRIGDNDTFGTGKIVALFFREPGWPASRESAPYQIQLDRATAARMGTPYKHALIFSIWDDDHQVRPLPVKSDCTSNAGMEFVD